MKRTRVCDLLGIEYPIIQAPMVWIAGADLAAAVSNAGGLGTIGVNAGATTVARDLTLVGERLRGQIRKAKTLTGKPFAVNFVTPENSLSDRYVEVALEEGIAVAVVTGDSPQPYTKRLKQYGIKVLYRPVLRATVEAAKKAEEAGVDAVIITGYESGGHSGVDLLSTLVLVPQVVDAVNIPVIAGGGIGDGRGAAAVLALGAHGLYIGTAFIATHECDAHPKVKEAIIKAVDTSTATWVGPRGFARALQNKFTNKVLKMKSDRISDEEIGIFSYSSDKYWSGLIEGNVKEFFVPMGAVAGVVREVVSAGELVRRIVKDSSALMDELR